MSINKNKTILIIEEDDLNLTLLQELFNSKNYNTVTSVDPVLAFDIAKKERPDLIVMAIRLPRSQGIEIVRWLKNSKHTRSLPILAVTISTTTEEINTIINAGCDKCITKPFSVTKFFQEIEELIGKDNSTSLT